MLYVYSPKKETSLLFKWKKNIHIVQKVFFTYFQKIKKKLINKVYRIFDVWYGYTYR